MFKKIVASVIAVVAIFSLSITSAFAFVPSFSDNVDQSAVEAVVAKADVAKAVGYKDVPNGSWSQKSIDLASRMGIVSGYKDGSFQPQAEVTRGEFVTMLANAIGVMPVATSNLKGFRGLAENKVKALKDSGFVIAYDLVNLDEPVCRAEMAQLLYALQRPVGLQGENRFSDIEGSFATAEINELAFLGVIIGTGNGEFDPNANATREQAVVSIMNLLDVNLDFSHTR